MSAQHRRDINSVSSGSVIALAAGAAAVSALALVGWAADSEFLTSFLPGETAMNPATAIGMLLIAGSLMLVRREAVSTGRRVAGAALSACATLLGVGCLVAYLLGTTFVVDQLLFADSLEGNRVAPNTAVCFTLLGCSLLLIRRKGYGDYRPFQLFALAAAIVSFLSIVGYGYGTEWLYGVPSFIPMALPTAVAAHALAWGILLARPRDGLVSTLTSGSLGGVMARRLIPAAFLFPVGLGWLRLLGQQAGWYDTGLGVALYSVLTAFALLGVTWWNARSLNAVDEARAAAADELRRLNEELEERVRQRTAELSAANRELRQKNEENEMFVYSVSHDLRAPLVNLQGFSQELAASCGDLRSLWQASSGQLTTGQSIAAKPDAPQRALAILDDDMEPSLRFIQSGVMRLSSIIDALLRLSRAGRVEYRWQVVDVAAIARRVVDSLQDTVQKRGATIDVGDLPPAWGDAAALEQVFANLISNALNYAAPDRDAAIEVFALPAPGGEQTYVVRDNGVGIAALHQPKVFQAFQRLHPSLAQGEGMGLVMTRRIVERHGGRIWFESIEGQGTSFFVNLPVPARAETPAGLLQESEAAYAN